MSLYYKKDNQLHRVGIVINSGEAAGHTIESSDGTDMATQPNLQFADAHVTNDTTNNRTKVEVTKSITESDFDDLDETDAANEGEYLMDADPNGALFTDDMIAHDATHTVREILNNRIKLLWENPSPTSSFASQQITLSSGDYDLLLIIHCVAISYTVISYASTVIPKGINANTVSCETSSNSTGVSVETRNYVYASDTQYTVGDAMRQTSGNSRSVNNQYLVPYKIYGIKF